MNLIKFFEYFLQILFRTLVWCLLTSNFQAINFIIGIFLSVIFPKAKTPPLKINLIIRELFKTLIAFPKAVQESFYLIFLKRKKEFFIKQRSAVSKNQNQFINFLDLFRITLTPLTLVTRRDGDNYWRVHIIEEKN